MTGLVGLLCLGTSFIIAIFEHGEFEGLFMETVNTSESLIIEEIYQIPNSNSAAFIDRSYDLNLDFQICIYRQLMY